MNDLSVKICFLKFTLVSWELHNLVEMFKEDGYQHAHMSEYVQTWRKKIRIKILVDIAKRELKSGNEILQVYELLDQEMVNRWRIVLYTRKQYLLEINKILNQSVLSA